MRRVALVIGVLLLLIACTVSAARFSRPSARQDDLASPAPNPTVAPPEPSHSPPPLTDSPSTDTPPNQQLISLQGRFEVEDYREGGEGVGFHDTTSGNQGGAYRDEDVDIERCGSGPSCFNVGWVAAGEWLAYDVSFATSGDYVFKVRVATPDSGRYFHIELNGVNVTGSLTAVNTGSWQEWRDVTSAPTHIDAGVYTLKIVLDTSRFNLDYVEVMPGGEPIEPPPPTATSVQSTATPSSGGGFSGPLMISPNGYESGQGQLSGLNPFMLRGFATGSNPNIDTSIIERLGTDGKEYILGFTSYRVLESILTGPGPTGYANRADYLKSLGVVGFTYNTENGTDWTPQDEMNNRFSTNPPTNPTDPSANPNSVAQFSYIAKKYGFDTIIWVPYRQDADNDGPHLQVMYEAGLSGVGLQHVFTQKISASDPETLKNQFNNTYNIHKAAKTAVGKGEPLMMMHLSMKDCRGDNGGYGDKDFRHCDNFIDLITPNLTVLSAPDGWESDVARFFQVIRD